jgi:uncharacterized membrane protein YgaE (UPF0421/DUF939 family)
MKNWKTTALGLVIAILVALQPILETGVLSWKAVVLAVLIAAAGYFTKDSNVTGGSVQQ